MELQLSEREQAEQRDILWGIVLASLGGCILVILMIIATTFRFFWN